MTDEFHSKIVGVTKKNEDGQKIQSLLKDMSEYCCEGTPLSLEHESDNPYDKNAIKVYYEYDHIGYISRDLAEDLAPLVDQQRVEAEISEITGGEDGKSFGCNILIRTVSEGETAFTDSREFVHLGEISHDVPPARIPKDSSPSPIPQQTYEPQKSYFDGTVLQHFGYSLLAGLFIGITLGIGTPWAYCGLYRWRMEHTVIESKRLEFDGKGGQLFLLCLKLFLIPILSFFGAAVIFHILTATNIGTIIAGMIAMTLLVMALFYGSYAWIKVQQWTASHTHFLVNQEAPDPVYKAQTQQHATCDSPAPGAEQKQKKDWVDIVEPILPLVCILLFCSVFFGIVFLIKHFFD